MLSTSSFVNTLEMKPLRASDFSLGEVALLPSCLIKDGILCLVFNLEFVYFQNNVGFVLTLRVRLCSKSRRILRVIFAAIVIDFIRISPSGNISYPHSLFLIS